MVKWYNISLPTINRGFDYPWPHQSVKQKTTPDGVVFCFRKQTTLLACVLVGRKHVFCFFLKLITAEAGEKAWDAFARPCQLLCE